MPELRQITEYLESFAPLSTCASYDNSGLKIGNPDSEITAILVTLDTNLAVLEEAKAKKCNLIIEHHPSIWKGWKEIDSERPLVRTVLNAYCNDIAIYSCHTNMDFAPNGLGEFFALKAGVENPVRSETTDAHIGNLPNKTSLKNYALALAETFKDDNVRVVGNLGKTVQRIALINGSGGSDDSVYLNWRQKTDVLVTAEVKYSAARLAKDLDYAIIELGHYNTENIFGEFMENLIKRKFSDVKVFKAEKLVNPYNGRVDLWD